MGSISSQDIAGRTMMVVAHELKKNPLFQGTAIVNLVTAPYSGGLFNLGLPEGQLELNDKG
eukprot:6308063-Ditylum_brightwellii.AAC.1